MLTNLIDVYITHISKKISGNDIDIIKSLIEIVNHVPNISLTTSRANHSTGSTAERLRHYDDYLISCLPD